MPTIDFDAERTYDDKRFSAQKVLRTDRSKVVCGYFEPGQFIPVHAPASDVVVSVQAGAGIVRERFGEPHPDEQPTHPGLREE